MRILALTGFLLVAQITNAQPRMAIGVGVIGGQLPVRTLQRPTLFGNSKKPEFNNGYGIQFSGTGTWESGLGFEVAYRRMAGQLAYSIDFEISPQDFEVYKPRYTINQGQFTFRYPVNLMLWTNTILFMGFGMAAAIPQNDAESFIYYTDTLQNVTRKATFIQKSGTIGISPIVGLEVKGRLGSSGELYFMMTLQKGRTVILTSKAYLEDDGRYDRVPDRHFAWRGSFIGLGIGYRHYLGKKPVLKDPYLDS